MLVPVILAGGSGTRLWPLSREAHPKQFLPLIDGRSLFQSTLQRVASLENCQAPLIIGNESHRFLMAEQVRQCKLQASILLEPAFKGTAPAIALAAMQALKQQTDVLLLVLPSDHAINDIAGFKAAVSQARVAADASHLVTFGITPTYAETGYGYIQQGKPAQCGIGFQVSRFVEKPDQKLAEQYVASKQYWWNSGMFMFSAALFLQEILLHEPEIFHATKAAFEKAEVSLDFIRPCASEFAKSPINSIDYAVMEKTDNGIVVPLTSAWNDVGAFDALAKLYPKDQAGNALVGDVLLEESTNCFVQANHRLLVGVGIKDLIIIETHDAILVLDRNSSQKVKNVVSKLKENERKEVIYHQRVNRPWGCFESIVNGERFQVKRITVDIGAKLSLQRHHHRSEHWVVVKGTARVTKGQETFLLSENQSTYIPIGVDHRLENVGKIPLEIIEVQSGAYLGEDDIVRLDDQYGRKEQTSNLVKDSVS